MPVSIAEAVAESRVLQARVESWRLDGELLLAHVLGRRREWLISHSDETLEQSELDQYRQLLERRQRGEPVAYLLGHKAFWDFDLAVNESVLVPRPETEVLVSRALDLLAGRENESLLLADLGTGSGAIAIALARHSDKWQVLAVEQSADALAVARDNASKLQVDNIEFIHGSWCEELPERSLDLIASNPPYIDEADTGLEPAVLEFEPRQALIAADHGLAAIRQIIDQARRCLKKDSWLLLEHGFQQHEAVAELLSAAGYVDIRCQRDYAGHPRVSMARWSETDTTATTN